VSGAPIDIRSRDNPRLAHVRRALRDPAAYRRPGAALWLEGDHLLRAARARGWPLAEVLVAESAWADAGLQALALQGERVLRLPDALLAEISTLESPARIGALVPRPEPAALRDDLPTVLLDRLQDAGNVGSILRSAAALGVAQVVALKGTAALWSPKVLRAGMGAHFALQLHESPSEEALAALHQPWVATSSHATALLHRTALPDPCIWIFGHEGQGVEPNLQARCALTVRIAQPGGEESLNVAAAAAICLYESVRQREAQ
jgi:TrmH family RNA methyltransferase